MGCEVSWFAPLCDEDVEFLGVPDPALEASWEHCRDIALAAEQAGYDNLLLPSNYLPGIDSVAFAAAIAPLLRRMQLLVAVRVGEMWAPQLARQLATIDQMLGGRLTINIISSDLPGQQLASAPRYRRTDVYLMWPDTMPAVAAVLTDMRARAARHGRELRFGYRAHVIVRDTETGARAAARRLSSRLDAAAGQRIAGQSLHSGSVGQLRQAELRELADHDGYAEPNLWTGIGRARTGAGAAIVGDPDQVLAKLRDYAGLGLESFILSGYPHAAEGDLFARHVLPHLEHGPLLSRGQGGQKTCRV